jgi:hypothetical protein
MHVAKLPGVTQDWEGHSRKHIKSLPPNYAGAGDVPSYLGSRQYTTVSALPLLGNQDPSV